ncbi:hypothetical protein EMIHUDRAFT_230285 [Emiliania huxleyi CCMP1516]|uniref:Uncharacterized protein n=2 Tax=Emiliania huxleyi TaxID=2903 RepID=A0A0D3KAV6_EMIH1|nr:hypothetical protein EMIHUDRAFT_230285 [Emiliania huxleyi CCMP1516]EOD32891.1 hypothetical protein EMIHUDRAFT_230285 [Emiliania huxleyi CCMP1516]|eukprot:XP_005785320.1 hypothetical protein EMIHUDRAFT_230285 [Emiliania huxleyi CCMP1516]
MGGAAVQDLFFVKAKRSRGMPNEIMGHAEHAIEVAHLLASWVTWLASKAIEARGATLMLAFIALLLCYLFKITGEEDPPAPPLAPLAERLRLREEAKKTAAAKAAEKAE